MSKLLPLVARAQQHPSAIAELHRLLVTAHIAARKAAATLLVEGGREYSAMTRPGRARLLKLAQNASYLAYSLESDFWQATASKTAPFANMDDPDCWVKYLAGRAP